MSIVLIRSALETALGGMSPSIATAYENASFTPPSDPTPYQQAFLRLSKPVNDEAGDDYTEVGYLQVTLCYTLNTGVSDIEARIDLLRQTFPRGQSFTASGVTVTISDVAQVFAGTVSAGRWCVSVNIPFWANITP